MVERWSLKPQVSGSIPGAPAILLTGDLIMPDYLGAKESLHKMSTAALALVEAMLPILDAAHAEKPEAGFDKQKESLLKSASELKFLNLEE